MYLCKECQFNFDTWKKSSLISETSFIVSYHHVISFVIQTTCLEREGQRKPPEVAYLHFFNWGTSFLLLLLLLLRTLLLEKGR
jgi:hypothetical protein